MKICCCFSCPVKGCWMCNEGCRNAAAQRFMIFIAIFILLQLQENGGINEHSWTSYYVKVGCKSLVFHWDEKAMLALLLLFDCFLCVWLVGLGLLVFSPWSSVGLCCFVLFCFFQKDPVYISLQRPQLKVISPSKYCDCFLLFLFYFILFYFILFYFLWHLKFMKHSQIRDSSMLPPSQGRAEPEKNTERSINPLIPSWSSFSWLPGHTAGSCWACCQPAPQIPFCWAALQPSIS